MGVTKLPTTFGDAVTPICNECGVALCYDISREEYEEAQDFWDAWRCSSCRPDARGSYLRYRARKISEG